MRGIKFAAKINYKLIIKIDYKKFLYFFNFLKSFTMTLLLINAGGEGKMEKISV